MNITSHIYSMYEEEYMYEEVGWEYHGDFVIEYADPDYDIYTYPFCSSENTTAADRPVLTVKYGYSLPNEMTDGGIYSFQNCSSFSYMSVNGTEPEEGSNIYQVANSGENALITQKFRLEKVSSTGAYLLRSMCSDEDSDMVAEVAATGGIAKNGNNVRLGEATGAATQEWLIIPVDVDEFKIVPRTNMALVLTTCGLSDGHNALTSSVAHGNIFVQTEQPSSSLSPQHWYIYDNNDNEVYNSFDNYAIETDRYYLSNQYAGGYLHRYSNTVNGRRDTVDDLGANTLEWEIVNFGNEFCTIQLASNPAYYMAAKNESGDNHIRFVSATGGTIPENCKWIFTPEVDQTAYSIRSMTCGEYLTADSNGSTYSISLQEEANTANMLRQIWRVKTAEEYDEFPNVNAFAPTINMAVGETIYFSELIDDWNADWTDGSYCFLFSLTSGGSYVQMNSGQTRITAVSTGDATIHTVHKVTGREQTFTVRVRDAFPYTSTVYNAELALKCAEYSMLAYDTFVKNNQEYTDTGSRTHFDSDANTNRRPQELVDVLVEDGFADSQIVSHNYKDKNPHNVSYTIASKPVTVQGTVRTLVFIIIRGTDGKEWEGNMDVMGTSYNAGQLDHYSFYTAAENLRTTGLQSYLTAQAIQNPIYVITGHSRGGAVANLLAKTLTGTNNTSNVFCYTFATPNNTTRPEQHSNIFNFCFTDDFISQVPLTAWEYDKHGITYTACAEELYQTNTSFKNNMDSFVSRSGRKDQASFSQSATSNVLANFTNIAPTLNDYYGTRYVTISLIPILTMSPPTTPYQYMHDCIASAAIGDDWTDYLPLLSCGITNDPYLPITCFFVAGSEIMNDNMYCAHCAYTYYLAVQYGLFHSL